MKNKKKFWKWIAGSIFLILFGTSAIINIAYLPKYFTSKNYEEIEKNQVLNINITAHNEINNDKIWFSFYYQTIASSLGDLMASASQTYLLETTIYGRMLSAVTYDETIKNTTSAYWAVWYNGEYSMVGIDSINLHANDKIDLRYSKI